MAYQRLTGVLFSSDEQRIKDAVRYKYIIFPNLISTNIEINCNDILSLVSPLIIKY